MSDRCEKCDVSVGNERYGEWFVTLIIDGYEYYYHFQCIMETLREWIRMQLDLYKGKFPPE